MDATTGGILGALGLTVSILGSILAVVNHTRIRSGCCGKKLEVTFDVEKTTPKENKDDYTLVIAPRSTSFRNLPTIKEETQTPPFSENRQKTLASVQS